MQVQSSGAAKATTAAAAIDVLTCTEPRHFLRIESAVTGTVCIDGTNYLPITASVPLEFNFQHQPMRFVVKAQRIGETDMTGVYAYAW
jgi:hypothetical protein